MFLFRKEDSRSPPFYFSRVYLPKLGEYLYTRLCNLDESKVCMRVILIQDVAKIGKAGDIKEVSTGYALNFLLPKGLAKIATPALVRQAEELRKKHALEAEDQKKSLMLQANALRDRAVVIRTKAEEGRLFGSVGALEISAALSAEGIEIDPKIIDIPKPFKMVGQYEVTAHFGQDVKAVFEVKIQGE